MNSILSKEEEIQIGNYYWIYLNDNFKVAKVVSIKNNIFEYILCELSYENDQIEMIENENKVFSTKDKTLFKLFEEDQLDPDIEDLSNMKQISYPAILYNLKFKAEKEINNFFFSGKLLMGINIVNNFTKSTFEKPKFLNKIQDIIYSNTSNQTLIINGGPLTGKSLVGNYLLNSIIKNDIEFQAIAVKVREYIELFGNAIVNRNNNSTRYLRVMKFYFLESSTSDIPIKVKFSNYLFEKNRITSNSEGTYKFHIIHSVIEGIYFIQNNSLEKVKEKFGVYTDEKIINSIKTQYQEIADFIKKFNIRFNSELEDFTIINFIRFLSLSKDLNLNKQLINKFNIILAILFLLDIEYSVDTEGKCFIKREENDKDSLYYSSIYLECEINLLKKRLTSREIYTPRGSFYVVKYNKDEAVRTRNGVIKYMYESLFTYVHNMLNLYLEIHLKNKIKIEHFEEYKKLLKTTKSIQIIECFALENDEKRCENNSLENLFTNYTNDRLSNLLFDCIIKQEAKLYENEGVKNDELKIIYNQLLNIPKNISNEKNLKKSAKINFNKNNGFFDYELQSSITSCEDKTKGIFKLLDTQSSISNGTFRAFCDSIRINWPNLITTNSSFYLLHFGEYVEYGAQDFIQKNIDSIHEDLKNITNKLFLKTSENYIKTFKIKESGFNEAAKKCLMKNLMDISNKNESDSKLNSNKTEQKLVRRFSQNMKLKSNSEKFISTINKLLMKVRETDISFIKLIRTYQNEEMNKDLNDKFVLKQIYSFGIIESFILAKCGCSLRVPLNELFRLKSFSIFKELEEEAFYHSLGKMIKIGKDDYVIGKTLFFVKNNAMNKNPNLRSKIKNFIGYIKLKILQKMMIKFIKVIRVLRIMKGNLIKFKKKIMFDNLNHLFNHSLKRNAFFLIYSNSLSKHKGKLFSRLNEILFNFHNRFKEAITKQCFDFLNYKLMKSLFLGYNFKHEIGSLIRIFKLYKVWRLNKIKIIKKSIRNYISHLKIKKIEQAEIILSNFILNKKYAIERFYLNVFLQNIKLIFCKLNHAAFLIGHLLKKHLKQKRFFKSINRIFIKNRANVFLIRFELYIKIRYCINVVKFFLIRLKHKFKLFRACEKGLEDSKILHLENAIRVIKIYSMRRLNSSIMIKRLVKRNYINKMKNKAAQTLFNLYLRIDLMIMKIAVLKLIRGKLFINYFSNLDNFVKERINKVKMGMYKRLTECCYHFINYKILCSNKIKKIIKFFIKRKQFVKLLLTTSEKYYRRKGFNCILNYNLCIISSNKIKHFFKRVIKLLKFSKKLERCLKMHIFSHSFTLIHSISLFTLKMSKLKFSVNVYRKCIKKLIIYLFTILLRKNLLNKINILSYKVRIKYFFQSISNLNLEIKASNKIKKFLKKQCKILLLTKYLSKRFYFYKLKRILLLIKKLYRNKLIVCKMAPVLKNLENTRINNRNRFLIKKICYYLVKRSRLNALHLITINIFIKNFLFRLKEVNCVILSANKIKKYLKYRKSLNILTKKLLQSIKNNIVERTFRLIFQFYLIRSKIILVNSIRSKYFYNSLKEITEKLIVSMKMKAFMKILDNLLTIKTKLFFIKSIEYISSCTLSINKVKKYLKRKTKLILFIKNVLKLYIKVRMEAYFSLIKINSLFKLKLHRIGYIVNKTNKKDIKTLIYLLKDFIYKKERLEKIEKIMNSYCLVLAMNNLKNHLYLINLVNQVKKCLFKKAYYRRFIKTINKVCLANKKSVAFTLIHKTAYNNYKKAILESMLIKINRNFVIKDMFKFLSLYVKRSCLNELNYKLHRFLQKKYFHLLRNHYIILRSISIIKIFLLNKFTYIKFAKYLQKSLNMYNLRVSVTLLKMVYSRQLKKDKIKIMNQISSKKRNNYFKCTIKKILTLIHIKFLQRILVSFIKSSSLNSIKMIKSYSNLKYNSLLKIQKLFRNLNKRRKYLKSLGIIRQVFEMIYKLNFFNKMCKIAQQIKLELAIKFKNTIKLIIKKFQVVSNIRSIIEYKFQLNLKSVIENLHFRTSKKRNVSIILKFCLKKSMFYKVLNKFYLKVKRIICFPIFLTIYKQSLNIKYSRMIICTFLKRIFLLQRMKKINNIIIRIKDKLLKYNVLFFINRISKIRKFVHCIDICNHIYRERLIKYYRTILIYTIIRKRIMKLIKQALLNYRKKIISRKTASKIFNLLNNRYSYLIQSLFFNSKINRRIRNNRALKLTKYLRDFSYKKGLISRITYSIKRFDFCSLKSALFSKIIFKEKASKKITKHLRTFYFYSVFIKLLHSKIERCIIHDQIEFKNRLIETMKKNLFKLNFYSTKISRFLKKAKFKMIFIKKLGNVILRYCFNLIRSDFEKFSKISRTNNFFKYLTNIREMNLSFSLRSIYSFSRRITIIINCAKIFSKQLYLHQIFRRNTFFYKIKETFCIQRSLNILIVTLINKLKDLKGSSLKDIHLYSKLVSLKDRIKMRKMETIRLIFLDKLKKLIVIRNTLRKIIMYVNISHIKMILHNYFGIYLKKVMKIIRLDNYYNSSISYLSKFFKQRIFNKLYFHTKEKLILIYFLRFIKNFRFKKNFKVFSKIIQKPLRILFRRSIRTLRSHVYLKIKTYIITSCYKRFKVLFKEARKFISHLKDNKLINQNNINDMFSVKYSEMNFISDYTSLKKGIAEEEKISNNMRNRHNTQLMKKISNEKSESFPHPLEKKNSLTKFK